MKYLLINASPRGRKSNSRLILSNIEEGIMRGDTDNPHIEVLDLRPALKSGEWKSFIDGTELIVICFPLYADLVPGILKQFIEELGPGRLRGKSLGWITHCGFPESVHLEVTERYLKKTTARLGAEPAGILKKGGSEGLRMMPPVMSSRLFENFRNFGEDLVREKHFKATRAEKLALPRKHKAAALFFIKIMNTAGFTNVYWNSNLRKNGAFKRRDDRPYQPE